jgi:hypothetical protein
METASERWSYISSWDPKEGELRLSVILRALPELFCVQVTPVDRGLRHPVEMGRTELSGLLLREVGAGGLRALNPNR